MPPSLPRRATCRLGSAPAQNAARRLRCTTTSVPDTQGFEGAAAIARGHSGALHFAKIVVGVSTSSGAVCSSGGRAATLCMHGVIRCAYVQYIGTSLLLHKAGTSLDTTGTEYSVVLAVKRRLYFVVPDVWRRMGAPSVLGILHGREVRNERGGVTRLPPSTSRGCGISQRQYRRRPFSRGLLETGPASCPGFSPSLEAGPFPPPLVAPAGPSSHHYCQV